MGLLRNCVLCGIEIKAKHERSNLKYCKPCAEKRLDEQQRHHHEVRTEALAFKENREVRRFRFFTDAEDDFLKRFWNNTSIADLADIMGRNPNSIYDRARHLKLHRYAKTKCATMWSDELKEAAELVKHLREVIGEKQHY